MSTITVAVTVRAPGHGLTAEDILDYHRDEPEAEIDHVALYFDVHPDSIRRILREAGAENPWKKMDGPASDRFATPEKIALMKKLAADGMVATWIAETVGLSAESVRKHLGTRPDVAVDWRPVWQEIRRNPVLSALHREFAPKGSRVGLPAERRDFGFDL